MELVIGICRVRTGRYGSLNVVTGERTYWSYPLNVTNPLSDETLLTSPGLASNLILNICLNFNGLFTFWSSLIYNFISTNLVSFPYHQIEDA